MDGGVDRAELDHLSAQGGDEATVGGAAAGGRRGVATGDILDAGGHSVEQFARLSEERQTGQRPLQVVVQAVLVENGGDALLQLLDGGFGGEAEVEHRLQLAGDDVGGASAGVEIGHLEAGRREVVVAMIPMFGCQFGQRRGGQVNRILRQVWVGDVALLAVHGECATEGATTAVLHHVTEQGGARRLADDAPVQALVTLAQALDHRLGAMLSRAFLVAGDQEGDGALVVRVVGDEALHGDDHARQAAFHVRCATAAEHAVFIDAHVERLVLPGVQRAGGHHIGVAGKTQHRAVATAFGPEVLHLFDAHALHLEAAGGQTAHHQLLATFVDRGHGRSADQVEGEFQGRGEGGGHCGSGTAASVKAGHITVKVAQRRHP